jgi:hypothetical protein
MTPLMQGKGKTFKGEGILSASIVNTGTVLTDNAHAGLSGRALTIKRPLEETDQSNGAKPGRNEYQGSLCIVVVIHRTTPLYPVVSRRSSHNSE